jgi:hypothetical protein
MTNPSIREFKLAGRGILRDRLPRLVATPEPTPEPWNVGVLSQGLIIR